MPPRVTATGSSKKPKVSGKPEKVKAPEATGRRQASFTEKQKQPASLKKSPFPKRENRFVPTTSSFGDVKHLEDVRQFCKTDNELFRYYRESSHRVADNPEPCPEEAFEGRGIVMVAGGKRFFPPAYVSLKLLRYLGCSLPIQVFHLGEEELIPEMKKAAEELNFELVDACKESRIQGTGGLGGWQAKPFSIMYSRFREVLFLDGDNVPVTDPEYMFDTQEFREAGAVFWPDLRNLELNRTIWTICGVSYRDEPEFETGQVLVDKARCWDALRVTLFMNLHAEFYYQHIWGDKDTFHMAWHICNRAYSMPPYPVHRLQWTMCQHDFEGNRLFQHRNCAKWDPHGVNPRVTDFRHEDLCLSFLGDYSGLCMSREEKQQKGALKVVYNSLLDDRHFTLRFLDASESDMAVELREGGNVLCSELPALKQWRVRLNSEEPVLLLGSYRGETLELKPASEGVWGGECRTIPCVVQLRNFF